MYIFGLIILLAIATVAGMIGQALAGYSLGGCILSAGVGLIGAFFGIWIAKIVGLPEPLPLKLDGETLPVFWAAVGATLFAGLTCFDRTSTKIELIARPVK